MTVQTQHEPTNREISVEKAVISKTSSTRKTTTPPLPSLPTKRKLSISLSNEPTQQSKPVRSNASPSTAEPSRARPAPLKSQVVPVHQNQAFHALSSDSRQTGRRTTGLSYTAASIARAGRPFRNLSHQNVSPHFGTRVRVRCLKFTRAKHEAGYIPAGSRYRVERDAGCPATC